MRFETCDQRHKTRGHTKTYRHSECTTSHWNKVNNIAKSNLGTGCIATPRGRPSHSHYTQLFNRICLVGANVHANLIHVSLSPPIPPPKATTKSGISIKSAVFQQYTLVINRRINTSTTELDLYQQAVHAICVMKQPKMSQLTPFYGIFLQKIFFFGNIMA